MSSMEVDDLDKERFEINKDLNMREFIY